MTNPARRERPHDSPPGTRQPLQRDGPGDSSATAGAVDDYSYSLDYLPRFVNWPQGQVWYRTGAD